MANRNYQFTDLSVTKRKFDQQVDEFLEQEKSYRRGGIICLEIEFPIFEFAFISKETNLLLQNNNGNLPLEIPFKNPMPLLLFSICIDYTNYDTLPPSIKLINPITSELSNLTWIKPFITPDQQHPNKIADEKFRKDNQNVLIPNNDGSYFFCLPGIKEYHEHPQHSGDSWFLHRKLGAGKICNILDKLQLYSVSNVNRTNSSQKKI